MLPVDQLLEWFSTDSTSQTKAIVYFAYVCLNYGPPSCYCKGLKQASSKSFSVAYVPREITAFGCTLNENGDRKYCIRWLLVFGIWAWINEYLQTAAESEDLICPFSQPPAVTGSSTHQCAFVSEPRNFSHSFDLQADLAEEEARCSRNAFLGTRIAGESGRL